MQWLPDDGPLAASLAGGRQHYGWSMDRYFGQSILDVLRKHLWLTARAQQGKRGKKMPVPADVPGPDELAAASKKQQQRRPNKAVVTVAQLAAHLPP